MKNLDFNLNLRTNSNTENLTLYTLIKYLLSICWFCYIFFICTKTSALFLFPEQSSYVVRDVTYVRNWTSIKLYWLRHNVSYDCAPVPVHSLPLCLFFSCLTGFTVELSNFELHSYMDGWTVKEVWSMLTRVVRLLVLIKLTIRFFF